MFLKASDSIHCFQNRNGRSWPKVHVSGEKWRTRRQGKRECQWLQTIFIGFCQNIIQVRASPSVGSGAR